MFTLTFAIPNVEPIPFTSGQQNVCCMFINALPQIAPPLRAYDRNAREFSRILKKPSLMFSYPPCLSRLLRMFNYEHYFTNNLQVGFRGIGKDLSKLPH